MVATTCNISELDLKKFNLALSMKTKFLKKDANIVLVEAGQTLVREAVKYTAPFGNDLKARKQGEGAVERDVSRSQRPYTTAGMNVQSLKDRLDKVAKKKDYEEAEHIFDYIPKMQETIISPFKEYYHKEDRIKDKKKLRVDRQMKRYTFDNITYKRYVKEMREKVGKLKASWMPAVDKLKVRGIPGWVTRHKESGYKHTTIEVKVGDNPKIVISNQSPGVRVISILQQAFDRTAELMFRKMKYQMDYVLRNQK